MSSGDAPAASSLAAQIRAGIIFQAAVMARRIRLRHQQPSTPRAPASRHSYLGEGQTAPSLLTLHGPLPHDEILPLIKDMGSSGRILLPILLLPDVVLLPSQTLPIRMSPSYNTYVTNAFADSCDGSPVLIGVVNAEVEPSCLVEER
jgi:hypothetical protein